MKNLITALLLVCLCIPATAQKTAFTTHDDLRLLSFSLRDMTDDGQFIAATLRSRADRMGVDHQRFRDPSYVSPSFSKLVIMNTETGEQTPVWNEKVNIGRLAFDPEGKKLAILKYDGDQLNLYIYNRLSGKLKLQKLKTGLAISSGSNLLWTPEGKEILLSFRAEGWFEKADSMYKEATVGPVTVYDSKQPFLKWDAIGNQNSLATQALVDLKTLKVSELLPEGNYNGLRFSKGNRQLIYTTNTPLKTTYGGDGGNEYEIARLSLDNPEEKTIIRKKSKEYPRLSWNEDNTLYAYTDSGHIFVQSLFDEEGRKITTDTTEIVKKDTAKAKFSINRWSKDGSHILASTKKGYWLVPVKDGEMKRVYDFPEDREEAPSLRIVDWTPDMEYLYMTYSAKDKWERGMVRYHIPTQKMEELVKDQNLYGSWTISKDSKVFIYSFSDGDTPADYYRTDADFSEQKRLTELNPWIKNKKLTRSELVKYRDVDGDELYGILYYPVDYEEGKQYPLVCEVYETFFNNGFNTSMNLIANEGFFGFRPSVDLEQGYPGEAWVKGVTTGINKLIDRGLVHPDKLGLHGTSYGGYAASLIITQTDRFAAAINISGKVNIISFLGDSPKIGTRNYSAAENGQDRIGATLWEAPMKYFATSAVLYADRVKTPHMLITGEGDWNVPGTNSREMYYALRRLGKEVVWVNYQRGGHGGGRASVEADYHDHWKRMFDFYHKQFDKADKKDKE